MIASAAADENPAPVSWSRARVVTQPARFRAHPIYGAGAEAGLWAFLLLLAGLPIYVALQIKKLRREAAPQDPG